MALNSGNGVKEFREKLREIYRKRETGVVYQKVCVKCNEQYDGDISVLTQNRCEACAMEMDFGELEGSVYKVLEDNRKIADCANRYHDTMPESQRSGKRHTKGG